MSTGQIVETAANGRGEEYTFQPRSAEEQAVIRQHLDQILSSSAFRHSKRYAAVLRFMVEHGLSEGESHLKERVIGVEVFGRAPDYDTSADHVVRSAAAEIRKRLAQYYQEDGAHDTLRIDLQRGTYIPLFKVVSEQDVQPLAATDVSFLEMEPVPSAVATRWKLTRLGAGILAALVVLVVSAAPFLIHKVDLPIDRFWSPLLASNKTILLCVGTLGGGHQIALPPNADNQMSLSDFHSFDYEAVHMNDAETLARIAGLIDSRKKIYQIASESQATYADLQRGPVVLIGLMNNDWTRRLVQDLRYSVVRTSPFVLAIHDLNHPGDDRWSVNYSTPYLSLTKDYAILVRATDPKTEQVVVTIAGLSVFGTMAAGRFVTDSDELKSIDAIAPLGWKHKNLELVLSVDVIRGIPGRPVILASHFW